MWDKDNPPLRGTGTGWEDPPRGVIRSDDGVTIRWDDAGHEGFYPARMLRLACPCAACVEEMTGRRLLQDDQVPADIRPVRIAAVGAYGIRVTWSDGHATGIYTFQQLRGRCPCTACGSGTGRLVNRHPRR